MNLSKVIKDLLYAKFFGYPFYSHLYVTRRCNMKCLMCNVWRQAENDSEMTLGQFDQCAEKMHHLGVSNVVFTGGEPFLVQDLDTIIRSFARRGITVRIQTNAGQHLTRDKLQIAIAAGMSHLTISLDSLNKELQDRICGVPEVLPRVKKVLQWATQDMPKAMIVVNTVVSALNLAELPEIVDFVHKAGAYSSLVPAHLTTSAEEFNIFRAYHKEFIIQPQDHALVDQIYDRLLELKHSGFRIGSSEKFLQASREYLKTYHGKWNCHAGSLYFVVFPDGSLSPCDEIAPSWNILDPDFKTIFQSLNYRREVSRQIKSCPAGCIYGCWRETSYLIHDWSVLSERVRFYLKNLF